jgi:predicted MFS family arabinose efflux permease
VSGAHDVRTGSERSPAWHIGFTTVLTVAMAIATFPQFALGALGPVLVDDLDLSRAGLGSLSTAFFIVATPASSFVGHLGERMGGRRLLAALFAVATASLVSMAIAPSYPWLLVAVGLGGLAIAASNPSTNALIAAHLPSGRRGAVVGLKQSGVQVGSFIAGAALPGLALAIGWRSTVLLVAVLSGAGLVAAVAVVPRDPVTTGRRREAGGPSTVVRWLVPYAFFMGAGVSATTAYLALYANETLGMSEAAAGALLAVVGAVGIVARILWGRAAERRPTIAGPLAVLTIAALASVALVWLAAYAGAWLVWPAAVGVGATAAAWNSVGMLAIVRETAGRGTSRASGHVLTGFYAGLLVMPIAFGALVDTTGTYSPAWGLTLITLAVALALTLAWQRSGRTPAHDAPPDPTPPDPTPGPTPPDPTRRGAT